LFFSVIRCVQLAHVAQELSYPFAFLHHLARPIPLYVVAIPTATWSAGAKAAMQTTAFSALYRRPPTRNTCSGLSAASRNLGRVRHMERRTVAHWVDLRFLIPLPFQARARQHVPEANSGSPARKKSVVDQYGSERRFATPTLCLRLYPLIQPGSPIKHMR
jgi:hypothetical protein